MDLCTCSPSYMLMHPRSACSNRLPTAVRRLCRVSVCCSMLHYVVALARLVLQSAGCPVGLRCSVLPCVSVYCSVFQCVAVFCGLGPVGAAVGRLSSQG